MTALLTASVYAGCSDDEEDDTSSSTTPSTSSGSASSSGSGSGATGATGGDGGAGAEGGTSSGGTGPGGQGGQGEGGTGGAGTACTWPDEVDVCGAGSYCLAPGCGDGTCVPIPNVASESPDKSPVCGCDGATYWNQKVAATHAMSVSAAGACTPGLFCGGLANLPCPRGLFCSYGGGDQTICLVSDVGGSCWGVPETCPMPVIGPTTRACGAAACTEECALIKQGTTFYPDMTCPQ